MRSWLLRCGVWGAVSVQGLRTFLETAREARQTSAIVDRILELTGEANCTESVWESARPEIEELPANQIANQPYATSLPVVYITAGGDREETFQKLHSNFTPTWHRVQAIDGENQSMVSEHIVNPAKIYHYLEMHNDKSKAVGCMMSHLMAIRRALIAGYEAAIILEDDAVPLTPWWPVSIEEFVLSLPVGWEASQLQWSTNIHGGRIDASSLVAEKQGGSGAQKRLYANDTGWGTAAYLISRRGMEKVINLVYDEEEKKFDVLRLTKHCHKFSADDCLLGFTDTGSRMTAKEVMKTAIINPSNVYKATPPFFLHGSLKHKGHRYNLCADMLAVTTTLRTTLPLTRTTSPLRKRMLLFMPATQLEKGNGQQILGNIRYARQSAGQGCCDVYPAFRRKGKHHTYASVMTPVDKWRLFAKHYKDFGESWKQSYDYIWVLDQDMDITVDNIGEVLKAADKAQAEVAQLLVSTTRDPSCGGSGVGCLYKRNDMVNLAAPLIRTDAIEAVLSRYEQDGADTLVNCSASPQSSKLRKTVLLQEWADDLLSGSFDGPPSRWSSAARSDALSCISLQASVHLPTRELVSEGD